MVYTVKKEWGCGLDSWWWVQAASHLFQLTVAPICENQATMPPKKLRLKLRTDKKVKKFLSTCPEPLEFVIANQYKSKSGPIVFFVPENGQRNHLTIKRGQEGSCAVSALIRQKPSPTGTELSRHTREPKSFSITPLLCRFRIWLKFGGETKQTIKRVFHWLVLYVVKFDKDIGIDIQPFQCL